MSRPDDGDASTIVAPDAVTVAERASSRSELEEPLSGGVIGRYRLVARLGAGAMGVVWSARDPQLDREVAIKLVHPSLARTPEASTRLLREARAMAKLSHRSVITVHDAGDVDGRLFLAMELVPGITLGRMLRGRTADQIADWSRWLAIMLDAGRGLAEAHRHGVLHRDFKPDNVLVDKTGRVCVGDFGLATLGEPLATATSQRWDANAPLDLTATGALLGTPVYMSPQQLRGEPIDARADQFAFCVATWEALYGTRPFGVDEQGLDAIPALASAIETGELRDPPAGSTVPDAVREVLRRGLAANPDARWLDMDALLDALERAGKRRGTVMRVERRGRWYVIAAGLVVLAAVGVAFAIGRRGSDARSPSPASGLAPKPLFGVSLRSSLTLTPDGTRVALASNRLEVRTLSGPEQLWSVPLPREFSEVKHLEVDDQIVRFSMNNSHAIWQWRYAGDNSVGVAEEDVGGTWLGTTSAGHLVARPGAIGIVDPTSGKLQTWSVRHVEVLEVSPDGRRVAYLEAGRFSGTIIVRDVVTGHVVRSPVLNEPTSLAWVDAATLLYSTGTLDRPRILRVAIVGDAFGPPSVVYGVEAGWFGALVARGNLVYAIEMHPQPRGRIVERTETASTRRDLDRALVSLGWTAAGEVLTWNRSTRRVDRAATRSIDATRATLDAEPVNATIAGATLIAALRRSGGREIVAVSLSDGRELWRHDTSTFSVRCAADRVRPCFAIVSSEGPDRISTIDPATGALGPELHRAARIADIAVREDGTRILVVGNAGTVREIDPTGKLLHEYELPLQTIRSVAYDPGGGILAGGTLMRNTYQVGVLRDGEFTVLDEASDDILSLVRPNADGSKVTIIARGFAPELWRLELP